MKVLVTGGAGYVGSHTCKALHSAGIQPVVFDNLSTGHADAVRWGPLVEGDLLSPDHIHQALEEHCPDIVMHFAAVAYVGESVSDPQKYYTNNVVGSLNLLNAMRSFGLNKIVFSSSCATYGVPDELPVRECTPQVPINPYGYTKLAVERALVDYERAYGIRWAAMRYFNAAGCDSEGDLGERHDPETHALPLAVLATMPGQPCFTVMGTNYPTPDGSAVRDYVHVSDLASAHVLAINYLEQGNCGRAFNLGTGRGTSVLELIASVERVTGRTVAVTHGERREGDPPVLYAAADDARFVLEWQPRHHVFDGIVATAARWFESSRGLG